VHVANGHGKNTVLWGEGTWAVRRPSRNSALPDTYILWGNPLCFVLRKRSPMNSNELPPLFSSTGATQLCGSHRGKLPGLPVRAFGSKCILSVVRPAGSPSACGTGLRDFRFAPSFVRSPSKFAGPFSAMLRCPAERPRLRLSRELRRRTKPNSVGLLLEIFHSNLTRAQNNEAFEHLAKA
jgi:hypothetical protein